MDLSFRELHQPAPVSIEIRRLLDQQKPATVLSRLEGKCQDILGVYRAEALFELDRLREAFNFLDPFVDQLPGEIRIEAERLRSRMLLRLGKVDGSILCALKAAEMTHQGESRAEVLAWSAVGLQVKGCWKMAEANLREAIELAPNAPRVLMAQARVRLEADQRIEARRVYERMARLDSPWAKAHGLWGCSHVAYLLGEFQEATAQAEAALEVSDEVVFPLFILGRVALAREDDGMLAIVLTELERRSPNAESLPAWQIELEGLGLRRVNEGGGRRKRLEAFPTLVQRRNYCGPAVVELVMRYWKGGAGFTNDQIAEKVKIAQIGTPIYRMREFFHLAGFDTTRTIVPLEKLKQLIEAGFPVIIQEEFSNSAHVAVVIGYDDLAEVIELQDPMTHLITRTPVKELLRLRRTYLDGALIAYPRGKNFERTLRRMGLFDEPALVWCDQAVLELDQNRFDRAIVQAEKAVGKLSALRLGWVMLLHARLESWKRARDQGMGGMTLTQRSFTESSEPLEERRRFYFALAAAKKIHPQSEFISQFEGSAALLDQDYYKALNEFQHAIELNADGARNYVNLAEVHYALAEFDQAHQAASLALDRAPDLPAANACIARAQAALGQKNATHYARMALDLSPDWWVAHQALAESYLLEGKFMDARREVEQAYVLAPGQPEVLALIGVILWRMRDTDAAVAELQTVLQHSSLNPVTIYQVHQALAQISFDEGLFEDAEAHAQELLRLHANHPWAVQLLAAIHCEQKLKEPGLLDEFILTALSREYERAVAVNQGEMSVIQNYIGYLEALAGLPLCLVAVQKLRTIYPENHSLIFLQGNLLRRAGEKDAALLCMKDALSKPGGVRNRDELEEVVSFILEQSGLEATEKMLLDETNVGGDESRWERRRALGLVLARLPERYGERARELLLMTLAEQAEDAEVVLRLGDVAIRKEDREQFYRQALMMAQDWTFARCNLAAFLLENGRATEALEFTTGHEQESLSMLKIHGKALFALSHYEEAVSILEQAVELDGSEDDPLLVSLWMAQMFSGMHKAALKTARLGTRQFPEDAQWNIRVGASLRELGRFDEARLAIEKALRKGLSTEDALRAEYDLARKQEDDEIALQVIEEMLALPGGRAEDGKLAWAERQYVQLLTRAGNLQAVRHFVEQCDLSAEGWAEAAWAVQESCENELLLDLAEKALALDPKQLQGLLAQAEALGRLGKEAEARAVLYQLKEEYPEEHTAYEKLALWMAAGGDSDTAFDYADRGVELGIFCPTAWATRGLIHALRGEVQAARDDLMAGWRRTGLERGKTPIYFWWLLAGLEGEMDLAAERREQALRNCQTTLEIRILRMIENMLAD